MKSRRVWRKMKKKAERRGNKKWKKERKKKEFCSAIRRMGWGLHNG